LKKQIILFDISIISITNNVRSGISKTR